MITINVLVDIITKDILQVEQYITTTKLTHPYSPHLVVVLLSVSLWKVNVSAIKNNTNKKHVETYITMTKLTIHILHP